MPPTGSAGSKVVFCCLTISLSGSLICDHLFVSCSSFLLLIKALLQKEESRGVDG